MHLPDSQQERAKCGFAYAFPFFQVQPPHISGEDDGRHVQNPGTGSVAQFAFAHAVEKELQEPGSACYA